MKLNLTGDKIHLWTLGRLFFKAFTICHIVGVMYHCLAELEIMYLEEENTWL